MLHTGEGYTSHDAMFTIRKKFHYFFKHLVSKNRSLSQQVYDLKERKRPKGSTIYALSSGYGKCGVAVIRVSGPQSAEAIKSIGGFKNLPEPRKVILRKLKDPQSKEILDHAIIIWFPGPSSFTGEDCCELQVHGGTAVISSVLKSLSKLNGFRPAEPGEFTRRAFYAGKFNLTEVEGLGDLINSETDLQRKQALFQMEGALSAVYSGWRDSLLECVAHVEAYIDFSEDQHLDDNVLEEAKKRLKDLRNEIKTHLCDGRKGERLRDGVQTVILGAPNVGKSSLMNTLCKHQAAIVTSIPGTTRDIVKSAIDINGFPIVLSDTAGLRNNTNDIVEKEGIERAKAAASIGDLIILVLDIAELKEWCKEKELALSKGFLDFFVSYCKSLDILQPHFTCNEIKERLTSKSGQIFEEAFIYRAKYLVVLNKVDLLSEASEIIVISQLYNFVKCISCKTEEGMRGFMTTLTSHLELLCGNPNREHPCYSQERHRHCLEDCLQALDKFFQFRESEVDLAAHELHNALNSLGRITGHVSTEQILDVIFKDFCIGK